MKLKYTHNVNLPQLHNLIHLILRNYLLTYVK